jgi:hypothetical protein
MKPTTLDKYSDLRKQRQKLVHEFLIMSGFPFFLGFLVLDPSVAR